MAISFVSAHEAVGASVNITTPQSGDVIFVTALRSDLATIPSLATGYTNIHNRTRTINADGASADQGIRVGCKVSNGTETNSGTWTNADTVAAIIYRGATNVAPLFGKFQFSHGPLGSPMTQPFMSLTQANNTSWVLACWTVLSFYAATPSGFTLRVGNAVGQMTFFDRNTTVTSFSQTTATSADAPNLADWWGFTLEVAVDPIIEDLVRRRDMPSSYPVHLTRRRMPVNRSWMQSTSIALSKDASIPGHPYQLPSYSWTVPRLPATVYNFAQGASFVLQQEVAIFPAILTDQPNPMLAVRAREYPWNFPSPLYLPEALVALLPYNWPNPVLVPRAVLEWLWPGVFAPPDPFIAMEQGYYSFLLPQCGVASRLPIPPMPLALRGKDTFFTDPGRGPSYDWPLPVLLHWNPELYRATYSNFGPGAVFALDPLIISMIGSKL